MMVIAMQVALLVAVGAVGPSGLGPGAGMWETEDPAAVGLSAAALSRAAEEVARVAPVRYDAHTHVVMHTTRDWRLPCIDKRCRLHDPCDLTCTHFAV